MQIWPSWLCWISSEFQFQIKFSCYYFNPFVPNAPFLYFLKTSENLTVYCFQRVEKGCTGKEWVNTAIQNKTYKLYLNKFYICFSASDFSCGFQQLKQTLKTPNKIWPSNITPTNSNTNNKIRNITTTKKQITVTIKPDKFLSHTSSTGACFSLTEKSVVDFKDKNCSTVLNFHWSIKTLWYCLGNGST